MNNTPRVGIIGSGGIARTRMIPGILKSDYLELTALMDPREPILQEILQDLTSAESRYLKAPGNSAASSLSPLADRLPLPPEKLPKVYTAAEELVQDPDVDIVYIASPVQYHLEQVRLAAEHGKHIICEKPLSRTVAEAEEMVRLCRTANVHAGCAFMMRFHTYHQQLRKLIASGALGQIVSLRAQQVFWYPEIPGSWRQVKALGGGGALMDVGVHNIDLLEYLLNSPTVDAKGYVNTRTFSYDVDDSCDILIQLENGAVAYVDGAFNRHQSAEGSLLEIYGTKGTAILRGTIGQVEQGTAEIRILDETGSWKTLTLVSDFTDLYTKEMEAFATSILTHSPEPVPMEQGLHIQKIAALFEET